VEMIWTDCELLWLRHGDSSGSQRKGNVSRVEPKLLSNQRSSR
jgi:hypothetical protein